MIEIHSKFRLQDQKIKSVAELFASVSTNFPEHESFLRELFNDEHEIKVQTSGSTGKPKMIRLDKKMLIYSAKNTIDFFDLKPASKTLLNLSSEYIAGKMMWIRALTGGWHLDITEPRSEIKIQKKYDFGAMIPMQVFQSLKYLEHFKKLIVGGGQTSYELRQKIKGLTVKIYATYGMTETATHIAIKPLNTEANKNFYQSDSLRDAFRIFDEIHISKDDRDCLQIYAPKLLEKPIVTNDVVEILDDKHFRWLGRYDYVVNSGGIKLHPEQIEEKLRSLISRRFFIAGKPDAKLGEKLILLIEGDSYPVNQMAFKKVLKKYEMPKEIIFIKQLQETPNGKLKRS